MDTFLENIVAMICKFEGRSYTSQKENLVLCDDCKDFRIPGPFDPHIVYTDLCNCLGSDARVGSYNNIFHLKEYLSDFIFLTSSSNLIEILPERNIVRYDFLFNRTKAFYERLDFGFIPWSHTGDPLSYKLPDISDDFKRDRIYLNPSKIYVGNRMKQFRLDLYNFLKLYPDLGYSSGIYVVLNSYFHSAEAVTAATENLPNNTYLLNSNGLGGAKSAYDPIHHSYYQNSFISIYSESTELNPLVYVTEKTFEPLIKGHFILPFAAQYFIKYLKEDGFQLPDFIDYGYDLISDDNDRYRTYIKEVERLINISINDWQKLYSDNLSLLKYNQSLFAIRPYDRILRRLRINQYSRLPK